MHITEDFVTTSLFTLVGIAGEDEVTVLDEVSSVTIDTKPLDWCVAAFISPNSSTMRGLRNESSTNLLSKLGDSYKSWLDINLNSQGVPKAEWGKGSSGKELPTLGSNITYCLPTEPYVKVNLEKLPSLAGQSSYYTSKEVKLKVGNGYSQPYMYYGVSPFLGLGTLIPHKLSQSVFNKLCTLLDNPVGIHLMVLGNYVKAQDIFGSGFWGLRQFMVDYYEITPSAVSTPLSTPLPFMYTVHSEVPDLGILAHADNDICSFKGGAIEAMVDLMWSILYFDYTYIGADPVEQDCYVASSWEVPGKSCGEKVPFNHPALVMLIGTYNEQWRDSSYGAYPEDEDVTATVLDKKFFDSYTKAQSIVEEYSPYAQCLANMASYSKAFAISMYRRTCAKDLIVMPSGKLYPKKTELRREIADRHRWFLKRRSLTTYIKVFTHLWEKLLWGRVHSKVGSTTLAFSFLCRSYNLPLSSILSESSLRKTVDVTLSTKTLRGMIDVANHNYGLLNVLGRGIEELPDLEFCGNDSFDSISNIQKAVCIVLGMYAQQVEYALKLDRYSIITKESFDGWDFSKNHRPETFDRFIRNVQVRRAWEQEVGVQQPWAYMALESMIKLWQRTDSEGLHKVLEILVSMLTGLEVDMPASMSEDVDYRVRLKDRIGIASTKKKLLDIMEKNDPRQRLGLS